MKRKKGISWLEHFSLSLLQKAELVTFEKNLEYYLSKTPYSEWASGEDVQSLKKYLENSSLPNYTYQKRISDSVTYLLKRSIKSKCSSDIKRAKDLANAFDIKL